MDAHEFREADVLNHHKSLIKDISQIEEQRDLFLADVSSLENYFEDVHKRYLKLKEAHQILVDENTKLENTISNSESWNRKAADYVQKLKQSTQDISDE